VSVERRLSLARVRSRTKAFPLVVVLALLSGCTTLGSLGSDELFNAGGANPDWSVSVGLGGIDMAIGPGDRHHSSQLVVTFPMVKGHRSGDVYIWESERDGRHIVVEDRPGPCRSAQGMKFPRTVRVRLDEREFEGCGGRHILVRG
jgi:uncharacterized membrane protein